jgi:mycothiol system anti-sigma-R factor
MADSHHDHDDHDHESGCREAVAALYTYLDGELSDLRRSTIQAHLDDCGPCLEAYDFEAELRIVVKTRCTESVPDDLRARILSELARSDGALSE